MPARLRDLLIAIALLTQATSLHAGLNPEADSYVFQIYPALVYGASPQNWAIAQDQRGLMYFANTEGLLEFDGVSWRLIRLSSRIPAVRSVNTSARGTVFVGGVGEFGLLKADATGTLQFSSLLDRIPESDRAFADVLQVFPGPGGIYFSSFARIFRLNEDGSVKVWRPASSFGRAFQALDAVYVKTPEQGLTKMQGDSFVPVQGGAEFAGKDVVATIPAAAEVLIATAIHLYRLTATGAEMLPTPADPYFAKNVINSMAAIGNGEIAVGTRRGGLLLMDPGRGGQVDRIVTKDAGLPDDNVTAIRADRQGGVWITGFNGIARLDPALTQFEKAAGLKGATETMARQGGVQYVGTTSGLFFLETAQGFAPRFTHVEGVDDTVWTLLPWRETLLAATSHGVFAVKGNVAVKILETPGTVWDISLSLRDPSIVYAAGLNGISVLREAKGAWTRTAAFAPAGREFRSLLEDADGRVWAATRGGIWRIDFGGPTPRGEEFGAAQNVPANWINVRRLSGHIVFTTEKGLRRYSEQEKRFAPDVTLGAEFTNGSRDVFNIFDDRGGNVWVTGKGYHGLLRRQGGAYRWEPSPLLRSGIREIYWMSIDDDGVVWATSNEKKLFRWDPSLRGNPDLDFRVLTRSLRDSTSQRVLYGGAGVAGTMRLPWSSNALRFEFAAPFYEEPAAVEYQFQLEGSDKSMSVWSQETRAVYTHLPEGGYRFRVRARSPHGAHDEQDSIAFSVLPPWYRTWWAWSLYLIAMGIGVWGLVGWRTRQLEADKRRLEGIVEERTVEIRQQRDEIHVQERKSHSLLLNILPETVADELQATGSVRPVGFDEVTVCFTDFVGFTLSSEKMQPGRLVDALNEYFTAFDEIMTRYGLEKLKTIGDSYMFVSGLPVRRASHAVDAVMAAMEMVEVVKRLAARDDGPGWNIRVGLHSGPVVAGVVGTRKFAFDIWGNTVNFAARMESSGVHGRVNMSEGTYELLRGFIECEFRGRVKIKEGRELPMFLAGGPAKELISGPLVEGIPAAFLGRYREEFGEDPRSFPSATMLATPLQSLPGAR